MGNYATTTSISELLPGYLQGNTTSSDTAGTSIFSRHIDRAEGIVNSYVGSRYSLPFIVGTTTTDVPPILRSISEDIACHFAIRGSMVQDGQLKNDWEAKFELAIRMLEQIRGGESKLTYTNGSLVSVVSNNRFLSSTEDYTPVFGLDDPINWKRDSDEIDDQSSARQ